eukprot:4644261-Karenia_brevis.AAC.1
MAPQGPVGLLLQHAHHFGVSLHLGQSTIHQLGLPPLNYMQLPQQCFKPLVLRLAFDAIHLAVSKSRTALHDLPKFDDRIFAKALPEEEHARNVVKSIATLSSVDQSLLH